MYGNYTPGFCRKVGWRSRGSENSFRTASKNAEGSSRSVGANQRACRKLCVFSAPQCDENRTSRALLSHFAIVTVPCAIRFGFVPALLFPGLVLLRGGPRWANKLEA